MEELDNIVDSQAAEYTKVVPTNQEEPKQQELKSVAPVSDSPGIKDSSISSTPIHESEIDEDDFEGITYDENSIPDVQYDDRYNIDVNDYKDILGSSIYITESGVEGLNVSRAINQSVWDQAGNFLAQTVVGEIGGGTIEGLGYLLDVGSIIDVARGVETEWGNSITRLGQGIRENVKDNFQIHQNESLKGMWSKMGDSGWWFGNGVSVASTFSMMIPVAGTTKALSMVGKGISASKGLRRLKLADNILSKVDDLSAQTKWTASGVNQAVMSRNIENFMEAHGTFEDVKAQRMTEINPETGKMFTEDEAIRSASQAASDNYKHGWAMLLQDIPQYLAIGRVFNPITKRMESSVGAVGKKGFANKMKNLSETKVGTGIIGFASEGSEEAFQYYISGQAKLKSDLDAGIISQDEYNQRTGELIGDEDMMTGAFFGGLGGNVFSATKGGIDKLFKNKDRAAFEAEGERIYNERLTNRMSHLKKLSQLQSVAEERGFQSAREEVLNNSMIEMVAEALENDKFELMYETLSGMQNMSQEEIDQLSESAGVEYSPELAKETTPKLVEMAETMRKDYLKLRNNKSRKVAAHAIKLKARDKIASKSQKKYEKQLSELREDLISESTPEVRRSWDIAERQLVHQGRIEQLEQEKKETNSDIRKKYIDKAIKSNKELLKTVNKEAAEVEKDLAEKKNLNEAQKNYNALSQALYSTKVDDIINKQVAIQAAKDQRLMNIEELNDTLSKEGSSRIEQVEIDRRVGSMNMQDMSLEQAENNVQKLRDDITANDYITKEESKRYNESLDKALAKHKKYLKDKEDKENAELVSETQRQKNHEANNNVEGVSNTQTTPIGDLIEDENANEAPLAHEQQLEKSERDFEESINNNGLMPLLNKVTASPGYPAFKEWSETPVSKFSEVFDFVLGDPINDLQKKAFKLYNEAKDYESLPQEVFDNLPIKAQLRKDPSIYSFITTKPGPRAHSKERELYSNAAQERVKIIQRLKAGVESSSYVQKSSGGDLILAEFDKDTGAYPRNNVLNLKQIGGKLDKLEILVTDEYGYLMNDRKERSKDFYDQITVGNDANGNPMPYRGGVFAKVRKANGDPFALRLNMANNTKEHSDLISEIIIAMSVPKRKVENGRSIMAVEKKDLNLNSTISEMNPELLEKVREFMSEEIDVLDSEFKDPLVTDLISMFVHMGDKTKGKTTELFFKDNVLYFNGKEITPDTKGDLNLIQELSEFIQGTKRRPFNLKLWNSDNDYINFALTNGLLTTNATIKQDLFQNTRKRNKITGEMEGKSAQMYMNPVKPLVKKNGPVAREDNEVEVPMNASSSEGEASTEVGNSALIEFTNKRWKSELAKAKTPEEKEAINEKFSKKIDTLKGVNSKPEITKDEDAEKRYTDEDFAKDNKGKKIQVRYSKYDKPFNATITGEVETVMEGELGDEKVKYVAVQVRTSTGKLLTANPRTEIIGKVAGLDKLSNNSNKIYISNSTQPTSEVKKGVPEVFKENPELANIGTEQQYSEYLDSIFPDSKVKDIVYHGTDKKFDSFEIPKNYGAFFSSSKGVAKKQKELLLGKDTPLVKVMALVDIKNPKIGSVEGFDASPTTYLKNNDGLLMSNRMKNEVVVVTKNPQIHMLGSKKDIQGFKDFVNKPTQKSSEVEVSEKMWKTFVDTGKIPQNKVNDIANKIKKGITLSDKELSMRTEYAEEIEKILNQQTQQNIDTNTSESKNNSVPLQEVLGETVVEEDEFIDFADKIVEDSSDDSEYSDVMDDSESDSVSDSNKGTVKKECP